MWVFLTVFFGIYKRINNNILPGTWKMLLIHVMYIIRATVFLEGWNSNL